MLKLTRIAAVALIGLAVVLALVALVVSRRATTTPAPLQVIVGEAPAARTWPVVAARVPLRAGIPIDPRDLQVTAAAQPVPGSYSTAAAVGGALPTRDIAAGSVLDAATMTQGFSLQLRPGERALAVPVDELVAAGNRIRPGDFVDVFLNLRPSSGLNTHGDAQARLLLSRLRVLSYGAAELGDVGATQAGTDVGGDGNDARARDIQQGSSGSGTADPATVARSAVLAVPVAEANRLLLGAQQGKLFLALRHPSDTGQPDVALFAAPKAVLTPRGALSPQQRDALSTPENDAFAGIDGDGLAGRSRERTASIPTVAPRSRAAPRLDRGIEIIRGDVSSHSGSH